MECLDDGRNEDWLRKSNKRLRHPHNRRFVTGRVTINNNKKVIHLSIGTDVCSVVEFEKGDRVHVFIHKENRNHLIIQRDDDIDSDGYLLSYSSDRHSFMTFSFRYESAEEFRLSQTTILDYDFSQVGMLLIDIEKLKWRK